LFLLQREAPVPDQEQGGGRWSLDHLFVDGDGVPVLVEVKRATDTRARREVVAQMLDYAANGVSYWPVEGLVTSLQDRDETFTGRLAAFLADLEQEQFWRQVDSNLRSGRIRMVFVADKIPRELARIVEFLNEQMRPAEVLAVEVEQFVSTDGQRTLVPRLIGATQRAEVSKSLTQTKPELTRQEWLEELRAEHGDAADTGARALVALFERAGLQVELTSSRDSLCVRMNRADGKVAWPFFLRKSSGRLETSLQNLAFVAPYRDEAQRAELLEALKSLPVTTLRSSDKLTGWPSISLDEFTNADLLDEFRELAEGVCDAISRGRAVGAGE